MPAIGRNGVWITRTPALSSSSRPQDSTFDCGRRSREQERNVSRRRARERAGAAGGRRGDPARIAAGHVPVDVGAPVDRDAVRLGRDSDVGRTAGIDDRLYWFHSFCAGLIERHTDDASPWTARSIRRSRTWGTRAKIRMRHELKIRQTHCQELSASAPDPSTYSSAGTRTGESGNSLSAACSISAGQAEAIVRLDTSQTERGDMAG